MKKLQTTEVEQLRKEIQEAMIDRLRILFRDSAISRLDTRLEEHGCEIGILFELM